LEEISRRGNETDPGGNKKAQKSAESVAMIAGNTEGRMRLVDTAKVSERGTYYKGGKEVPVGPETRTLT